MTRLPADLRSSPPSFICRPDSYRIFFPGELLFYEPSAPRAYARCNVWALQAVTCLVSRAFPSLAFFPSSPLTSCAVCLQLWDYAIGIHHADLPQSFKDAKGMDIWEETLKIERLFHVEEGMKGSAMGLFWQQVSASLSSSHLRFHGANSSFFLPLSSETG